MRFLITAGGTREYIDPVRFISNASTGRIGVALSRAAVRAGHKVTLISAAAELKPPAGCKVIYVEASGEMFAAVKKHFGRCDCLIMAAAVSDYAPIRRAKAKIKKTSAALSIKLKPTPDILKWAGGHKKKNQIVVGFALEDTAICKRAEAKLKSKRIDMIIANTPAAIGGEKSTVHIKTAGGNWQKIENTHKAITARKIIQQISLINSS